MQDVRFSPKGENLASVGSDAKIYIYDGVLGDTKKEITSDSHTGSIVSTSSALCGDKIPIYIYHQTACGWSPDGEALMTASADCTVKLCKRYRLNN